MLRNVFGHITVMPHLHNAGEALALLTRLARIVEPIMISRGLFVEHLTEFLPQPEERLLGRNYGQGWWICIGLRKNNHRGINQFRPEEDLLGTLLHELTHNLFGRHGADFHGYLKGLKDQVMIASRRDREMAATIKTTTTAMVGVRRLWEDGTITASIPGLVAGLHRSYHQQQQHHPVVALQVEDQATAAAITPQPSTIPRK
ncbi:WLM domain-containing protein [Tricharina praecox]|uniref:WLM domain-containing protein n=1 Tax=Tricharina praecox TaxID=43433 RepID=UPI00221EDEB9|nr:WLM domain-containing protein [Tricharina praecox]KAI5852190.1 WLM domain-containing protein [Tricharina praecox]